MASVLFHPWRTILLLFAIGWVLENPGYIALAVLVAASGLSVYFAIRAHAAGPRDDTEDPPEPLPTTPYEQYLAGKAKRLVGDSRLKSWKRFQARRTQASTEER